ncbi:MAG: hypothetical protein ACM3SS_19615 [Rhodospirillaceae bacterium]
MAVILVTYDLKQPGRNYQPVWDYLKRFTYCKGLESVWLLDTTMSPEAVRDDLRGLVDPNDRIFAVRLFRDWASFNYGCADWLNDPARSW